MLQSLLHYTRLAQEIDPKLMLMSNMSEFYFHYTHCESSFLWWRIHAKETDLHGNSFNCRSCRCKRVYNQKIFNSSVQTKKVIKVEVCCKSELIENMSISTFNDDSWTNRNLTLILLERHHHHHLYSTSYTKRKICAAIFFSLGCS